MNKKNKFGIKTRVFLAFPFFVIIITNIFATFLYIFIEKSFINNVKNDIDNLYEKIEINLEKQNGSKILNINESLENEVQNKGLFVMIGDNDKSIIENYNIGYYLYDTNLIFRNDFENYNIIIGKDIKDILGVKKEIINITILLNIFGLFITFLLSYLITKRVLNPLIKLGDFVKNYNLDSNNKLLKNNYGDSEIGKITDSINGFIKNSKDTFKIQKDFIQDISHELKTPLMQIESNIELIEEKITDEKIYKKIMEIKSSTQNLDKIVTNLSFLLRGEKQIMEKKNINLYDFLYNYSKEFESLAEKKNIKIKIEKKYDLVIENNSYYLERLFGNIISNSIQYNNGDNEIKIKIEKDSVVIKDKGIGINKDEEKNIFNRFYRNNNSQIYNDNGNGLGLTIVKKICDNFGWEIKISSKKDLGTEFIIILKK